MTKQTTTDWTVSALSNADGIGNFLEGVLFTYVPGQMGNSQGNTLQTRAVQLLYLEAIIGHIEFQIGNLFCQPTTLDEWDRHFRYRVK